MANLPFVTQPAQPTYTISVDGYELPPIPRYWDLTLAEKLEYQELTKGVATPDEMLLRVSKQVSTASGMPFITAANAFQSGDASILEDHMEELFAFRDELERNEKLRKDILITLIIKHRLQLAEWTVEDTNNPEKLPYKVREAVLKFAEGEKSHWAEGEPLELTEENLGKLPNKGSKTGKQTGRKSSGHSNEPTPDAPNSAESDLQPTLSMS